MSEWEPFTDVFNKRNVAETDTSNRNAGVIRSKKHTRFLKPLVLFRQIYTVSWQGVGGGEGLTEKIAAP